MYSPAPSSETQRRQVKATRRWHHRKFSGCVTCRRRHVKCDELKPFCRRCQDLGVSCEGYGQKLVFKFYEAAPLSTCLPPARPNAPAATVTSDANREQRCREEKTVWIAAGSSASISRSYPFSKMPVSVAATCRVPPQLMCLDAGYASHFLSTVSTILIVWDAPYNSNPYRQSLPYLAQTSLPLTQSMKALGALHLANTSFEKDRARHMKYAMKAYGEIISHYRASSITASPKLADLAACLLLCLFEMMDSQGTGWKVHLLGASTIYHTLFSHESALGTHPAESAHVESTHPIRHFLVSLLAYLDVAGACSTGEKTLVSGDYWETHGGGWEYNLGVPSFSNDLTDNGTLGQIRQSWSQLMSIQAGISAFAESKRAGISTSREEISYHDLECRLRRWRLNAPDCLRHFVDDKNECDEEAFVQEAMGFVEAYEKATIIYLHKVSNLRKTSQELPLYIAAAVRRILVLAERYCTGIVELGMPWALFIAGTEVSSVEDQEFVRNKFQDMSRFGMKNVQKALHALESTWLSGNRTHSNAKLSEDFLPSILLP